MIKLRQWLALFVLSAPKLFKQTGLSGKLVLLTAFFFSCFAFFSCKIGECDCVDSLCFSDQIPPEPIIQFDLVDENGKSWFDWKRGNFIDSIKLFNEKKKLLLFNDTSLNCSRTICFKFNESPSRETINKFILHKYFLDLHINGRWDTDTLLITYKTDIADCSLDSIEFTYNDSFKFRGLNESTPKATGFDVANLITKKQ
jgi:hypothetical protein